MDTWQYLSDKTKRVPFLGVLDFKRKTIKKSNDSVYITTESKYRNSGLLSLITAFILWILTWRAYPYSKVFGNLFLIFVSVLFSLMAVLFLSYKKRIFWEKGKNQLHFLWGFYPFVITKTLDSTTLEINTDIPQGSKSELIYFTNSNDSKIVILKSKDHKVIVPVLDEISSFLRHTER